MNNIKRLSTFLLTSMMLGYALSAHAVRPFVTDDARIIDYGQVEVENWLEFTRADGETAPAPGYNAIVGVSLNDWFEVLAGGGFGRDPGGKSAVGNPVLMGKILLKKAELDGDPGYAISAGTAFNSGRGSMYDDGRVYNIIGMTTYRMYEDRLNIHINLGARTDKDSHGTSRTRAFWGIGSDVAIHGDDIRFVAEAFAGDPLVPNAPKYAIQTGFRWLKSEYTQFDLTFGVEPELDDRLKRNGRYEKTAQIGIRMLFDAFTRGGKPGSPDGAPGLF